MILGVHIADGVMQPSWWLTAWLPTALLIAAPLWRLSERDVPRLGLAAALFFIASSVPIPVGVGRVHLLGTGVVGLLAGWRASLPVAVGLFLQSRLLGHGGLAVLGFNIAVMGGPAVVIGILAPHCRLRGRWPLAILGFVIGFLGVAGPVGMAWIGLRWGAVADVQAVSWFFAVAHLPIAVIEGVLTAALMPHLCLLNLGQAATPRGRTVADHNS